MQAKIHITYNNYLKKTGEKKESDIPAVYYQQAAFYIGNAKDLWCGFPNCSAYWHMIMVFGVKWHMTEVMPGSRLTHRCNGGMKNNYLGF